MPRSVLPLRWCGDLWELGLRKPIKIMHSVTVQYTLTRIISFSRRDKIMNYFSVMVSKKLRNDEEERDPEDGGNNKSSAPSKCE